MTDSAIGGKSRQLLPQNGRTNATMKNGSQQLTNEPVMTASVLAAFRSLFCSSRSLARCSYVHVTNKQIIAYKMVTLALMSSPSDYDMVKLRPSEDEKGTM